MTSLKVVLITLLFAFPELVSAQKSGQADCGVLKNCKYKNLDATEDSTAYILASNGINTEYFLKGKYYVRSKVEWLKPCEYRMTVIKSTLPNFPFHPGDTMNVKVDRIDNGLFYTTSTANGTSWKGKYRIVK
jgi:hypothetical protein